MLLIRAVHFKHFWNEIELQGLPQMFNQVSFITLLHLFGVSTYYSLLRVIVLKEFQKA